MKLKIESQISNAPSPCVASGYLLDSMAVEDFMGGNICVFFKAVDPYVL